MRRQESREARTTSGSPGGVDLDDSKSRRRKDGIELSERPFEGVQDGHRELRLYRRR